MRKFSQTSYRFFLQIAVFCSVTVLASFSHADILKLKNTDQISGRLLKVDAMKVVIKTEYAGEVTIDTDAISSLSTDTSVSFFEVSQTFSLPLQAQLQMSSLNGYVGVDGKNIPISALRFDSSEVTKVDQRGIFDGLEGRVDASLENSQNKTPARYLEIDGSVTWDMQPWRHKLDGKIRNYTEDNEKSEDSKKLEYSLDYFFTPEWFIRANNFYQSDRVTAGSNLYYHGLGLGRNLWKDKSGSAEIMGTYNSLVLGKGPSQFQLNAWVVSLDFKRKFNHGKWEAYAKADWLFPQHVPVSLIMQSELGLRYQLNTSIYLTGKLVFDMSKFSVGTVKSHSYKMGIGTRW
ncbi:DUF481 domain-containing protein [Undibacterium sp. Di24W]|uniref:DUF481 domain-containing protein n=1 Tax=Undibacterium sp. Di24W TaxID=3413033 RepID=UPI003BF31DE5